MDDLNTGWEKCADNVKKYRETYRKWKLNRCTNVRFTDDISKKLQEFEKKSSFFKVASVTAGVLAGVSMVASPFTGKNFSFSFNQQAILKTYACKFRVGLWVVGVC